MSTFKFSQFQISNLRIFELHGSASIFGVPKKHKVATKLISFEGVCLTHVILAPGARGGGVRAAVDDTTSVTAVTIRDRGDEFQIVRKPHVFTVKASPDPQKNNPKSRSAETADEFQIVQKPHVFSVKASPDPPKTTQNPDPLGIS